MPRIDLRVGAELFNGELANLDLRYAREMAAVGIIPSDPLDPIGHKFVLSGQNVIVTGYATREEFMAAVKATGMNVEMFHAMPARFKFQRISTD